MPHLPALPSDGRLPAVRGVVLLLFLLAAVSVGAVWSSPARAHAALVETSPADGEVLDASPSEVHLTFNETVNAPSGGIRVYDSDGARVDRADQGQSSPDTLTLQLPELGNGTYVATYRVTSADGHVVRGAFIFNVGAAEDVAEDTLAAIFSGGDDQAVALAGVVNRAVGYGGVLLVIGAAGWWVTIGRRDRDEGERARLWLARGAAATAVTAALTIPLQAMLVSGAGLGVLGDATLLADTAGASVGVGALWRLAGSVALLVALRVRPSAGTSATVATVVGLSLLVDGHTRTVDPAWLMLLADAVHVVAVGIWFGGLVLLGSALRARRLDDDVVGAASVVSAFSTAAVWSLLALAAAGSAMSWALVRQPRALTSTDYGWTLVLKVALVAVVGLVGLYNNRRLVPAVTKRSSAEAWGHLRRTTAVEVGLLVLVVVATAFLVNLRPAAEEAGITGPFDTIVALDDLQLNLVVDPNRAGFNSIHMYLFDATGRPLTDADSVTLRLSQAERDIGPIERTPFVAGPGHWQVDGRDLAFPGAWQVEVVVGIDRFTEVSTEVTVVVNG